MKLKRNYQIVQFLLDCFSAVQLYLLVRSIIEFIIAVTLFNVTSVKVVGGEVAYAEPYPIITWGILGIIVYLASIILPLIFKIKTKFSQKQFNMWVYAVLLIRIPVLLMLTEITGKHASYILRNPESIFSFQIIADIFLIIIIIIFTRHRIKAAKPVKKTNKREIVED
ncbi:MAG: hypothetical protein FWD34_07870 [Oscillospiraceae bacterium]|nr:hypothetical protein [Oscillospiraceae bacterium]